MKINSNSTAQTKDFYKKLINREIQRDILGLDKRFNAEYISKKENVEKYFLGKIKRYINKDDRVLDLGCGTGGFSIAISPYCKNLVCVDILQEFVDLTKNLLNKNDIKNAKTIFQSDKNIPCDDNYFDSVILVDVIHHVEDVNHFLSEVRRVLRPGGKVLIFEPNKINPLIYLMHLFDSNERGLLNLGKPSVYKKVLSNYLNNTSVEFSGLVVGPNNNLILKISNFLSSKKIYFLLGWLLPKIFICAEKSRNTI